MRNFSFWVFYLLLFPFLCGKLVNAQHPINNDCFDLKCTFIRKTFNTSLWTTFWDGNTVIQPAFVFLQNLGDVQCYKLYVHQALSFIFFIFTLKAEETDFNWDGQHHTGQSRNRSQMAWLAQWINQKALLLLEGTHSSLKIIDLLISRGLKFGCLWRNVFFKFQDSESKRL